MAADTFAEVIAVEKEIKENIAKERLRVDRWLEHVKKEMAVQYRHEIKKLKDEVILSRKAKIDESEDRIRETLESARDKAQKLEGVDDRELKALLEKALQRLVPEKTP